MKRIEFHDRERETKEITDILDSEPSLITFVYGPINSGKTALINHLIDHLPECYAPFYINLRGRFITDYEDFQSILFEIDEGGAVDNISEYARSALKDLKIVSGIPIPVNLFQQIFEKKDKSKDMFRYIERFFTEISEKRMPVLIIDELQVIGDMEIDGHLIYKLFNFFVRLTKELHLAHVFVVTSDSLFIERVYSEAMLSERCKYLLADDFDYETTMAFLDHHGFNMHEKEIAWHYVGGKPVSLVRLINEKRSEKKIEDVAGSMLKLRTGEIMTRLKIVKELGSEITMGNKCCDVHHEILVSALKMFATRDEVSTNEIDEVSKGYLVKENILFADPLSNTIKPQSMLNLLAIREAMENV
ncbi:MAG: ATP-binding protein [Candidatus Methanogaster sp.]|uniref:ATP-binding protein n=1 Tax=Candidatus Methanogaster sp. TaxID=3386292 RepID=A0AC61L3X1_9EURY|nr:MAG: ATP-binding protein [ANME-2 cluster archaeon]